MGAPEFWNDSDKAKSISSKAAGLKKKLEGFLKLEARVADIDEGISLAKEYDDPAEQDADRAIPPDAEPSPYLDDTPPVPAYQDDRLVVFTARYRLTRKGPDRGNWLFECGATADAPLATVDAVARGVTQRSKDLTETERLSGDQLRTLLQDPAWRMPA